MIVQELAAAATQGATVLELVDTVVNILTFAGIIGIAFAAGGAKKSIGVLERDVVRVERSVEKLGEQFDRLRSAIGSRETDRRDTP